MQRVIAVIPPIVIELKDCKLNTISSQRSNLDCIIIKLNAKWGLSIHRLSQNIVNTFWPRHLETTKSWNWTQCSYEEKEAFQPTYIHLIRWITLATNASPINWYVSIFIFNWQMIITLKLILIHFILYYNIL